MATKTYSIPNFDKGLFMAWEMFTQAAYTITVTLKDSAKTYVHATESSTHIDPPLAQGNAAIEGTGLSLQVDIPQSSAIKASINSYTISREDGRAVGYGFNLCVEDSGDQDYNDLYVSLVCWLTKG